MKKVLAGVMAGVMTVGMLTGCSGGAKEPAETKAAETTAAAAAEEKKEEAAADGEKKVLDVVWFSDSKEGESFKKLTEKYQETHPNIEFELIEVPYADMENKLKNMVNAGEAPALARLTNVGLFRNQLINLYDYVPSGADFKNNFGNGLKFDFDGVMLGAPMEVTANGIIYNKTAFDQAGVKVPQSPDEIWTWDEFEEALKTVVANSDVKYGLAYDFSPHRYATLLYQAEGSFPNEELNASNVKGEGFRKTIEWFKHLHDEGVIPTSVWLGSENPNEMFRTGQVAAHMAGSWMIGNYKNEIADFEWGVTYNPVDVQRATIPGGKYLGAFQGTGVEKEAAEFIEWISQPENNAQYCMENYYLSQVKGNESLPYDFGAESFAVFSDELNASAPQAGAEWGFQEFTSAVTTDFKAGIQDVLAENITVDEFVENMDALVNEVLADLN